MPNRRRCPFWLVALGLSLWPAALLAVEVRFEINDAHVRGKPVAGVRVTAAAQPGAEPAAAATSDDSGGSSLDLPIGVWWISYLRPGYIPIRDSAIEIRGPGQVVTTTLSMLLEAEGGGASRRVRIVLNWGSAATNVEDVDAHAYCVCEEQSDAHVYYADMKHEYLGHRLELDVDDRHWGGPETITLSEPVPGAYSYWVHQYSQDEDSLGESAIVVRVYFNDRLAATIEAPASLTGRVWKPFKAVVVDPDFEPRLVRFDRLELAAGADREPPPDNLAEESRAPLACNMVALIGLAVVVIFAAFLRRMARRPKSRPLKPS